MIIKVIACCVVLLSMLVHDANADEFFLPKLICTPYTEDLRASTRERYSLDMTQEAKEVAYVRGKPTATNIVRRYSNTNETIVIVTSQKNAQSPETVIRITLRAGAMTAVQQNQVSDILQTRLSRSAVLRYHRFAPLYDIGDDRGNASLLYTEQFVYHVSYLFRTGHLSHVEWLAIHY